MPWESILLCFGEPMKIQILFSLLIYIAHILGQALDQEELFQETA